MPTQRPAIPYTLSTILPNGIVSLSAWKGLQDAITSIHQRGKVVLSAHSQRNRNAFIPLMGIAESNTAAPFGINYGGAKEIPLRFQIPAGYDRFCMIFGYKFPLMVQTSTGQGKLIHAAVDFRLGDQVHRVFERLPVAPYSHTYAIEMRDGILPIPTNTGVMISAALSLYFAVGGVSIGTAITPIPGRWYGFDFITMALYRNDAC